MNRRRFLAVLSVAVLGAPRVAETQLARKVSRVAYLASVRYPGTAEPFLKRLRDLGYVEGANIRIDYSLYGNRRERLPELAADLVRTRPAVIVAVGPDAILAATRATNDIPIVMVYAGDPLRLGIVKSLARPGGNVTGFAWDPDPQHAGKSVEILREVLPNLRHVALLWNRDNESHPLYRDEVRRATAGVDVKLLSLGVRRPDDFDQAFHQLTRERAEALIIFPDPLTVPHAKRIMELAIHHRVPMLATARLGVTDVLLVYGPYTRDQPGRAAEYVNRILNGTNPGDLPVVQPTRMELIINLKTAEALGLTIPPSLLLRADHVIE